MLPDAGPGPLTHYVRAAVRTVGLAGAKDFDVSAIGMDTDLSELGVDSMIVGELHTRLLAAYGLAIDPSVYCALTTPRQISDMLRELQGSGEAQVAAEVSKAAAAPAPAVATTYSETLRSKGLDGVIDRAYRDAWGALWG